ncbi:histidine kinase [Paraflavitalea sp. CAU 1676]|uniref:sensor histidine kinase n=1 Tax=Paraflavitalea sp. CAU 1676 TaxID=3032598 RepID=UPI0023DCC364|nr:histidine kinase [Paraflavitalea sp. CAU 1676]MDF2189589.1 histidine kinase [Paraflavitalea sp. CAU 1676]
MYRVKTPSIVSHVIGWLIFLSLPFLFIAGHSGSDHALTTISASWYWLLFGCYVFIFYLHTYVLFPQLYLKKKAGWYFGILLLMLVGIYGLRPFDRLFFQLSKADREARMQEFRRRPMEQGDPMPADGRFQPPPPGMDSGRGQTPAFDERRGTPPDLERNRSPFPHEDNGRRQPPRGPRRGPFDFVSIFLFLLAISLSIALQTTWRWRLTEKRALQAEAEKAQAELAFLKAQINPHFLFNTLNNIYSLAVTNNEHTAASIMKLSNILRYITDETRQDFVPLQQEIECIQDYIDLQQLRLGQKTTVSFKVIGNVIALSIPPFILMTFVENAFKYGISNHQASLIDISLEATDNHLLFRCSNSLFPRKQAERTGIGIENTRQRLEHLYPGRHSLNISTGNNLFEVVLDIHR